MYRLLETIKIKNGVLQNINFHNERFNRSRYEIFGIREPLLLENEIKIPEKFQKIFICKCRLVYSRVIEKLEIVPYTIPAISSLKIIVDDNIQYRYKSENRDEIHRLYAMKDHQDDILIIRNGLVTDTSYCNVVFSDGIRMITPSSPLLKGTKRELMLREGIIREDEMKLSDIRHFKKAILINAMIDMDDKIEIPTDKII